LFFLSLFHFLEFILTALYHPDNLSFTSFLVDHSKEYHFALVGGAVEFIIEWYFFPSLKKVNWIWRLGVVFMTMGQLVRTQAMYTAENNFTHVVAENKNSKHSLVTSGLYSLCRHPSYAGWFYWSIGSQLVLQNPLCFFCIFLLFVELLR